jgi:hypothetical protein
MAGLFRSVDAVPRTTALAPFVGSMKTEQSDGTRLRWRSQITPYRPRLEVDG